MQVLKHAFTYHWKVWTIAEALELLHEAGFEEVHVWIRCMIVSSPTNAYRMIQLNIEHMPCPSSRHHMTLQSAINDGFCKLLSLLHKSGLKTEAIAI